MSSNSNALLQSIRRWLLVAVFLLGICVVLLADTGYMVSGYQDGLIFAVGGLSGGTLALIAGIRALATILTSEETS